MQNEIRYGPLRKGTIIVLLIGLGFCLFTWAGGYMAGPHDRDVAVMIPAGAGFRGSVTALEDAHVLRSTSGFYQLAVASGKARRFKAGEYRIPARATAWDIIDLLSSGKTIMHRFTVPEGWTVKEVMAALDAIPELTGETPKGIEEGALLPETYLFSRGDTRAALTERMRSAMQQTLQTLWDKRDPSIPLQTPEEAVTLASIVEEETGVKAERARIAGLFYNRLKLGMKIQSDPTVLYGLNRGGQRDNRSITRSDLASDTEYNTYVISGLPPGPICNPGRASLRAVMQPEATEALYFVADGQGGHRFGRTLAEHNANVAMYRKSLK